MTDQLTRIERMLSKALEDIASIQEDVTNIKENLPEKLLDIEGELNQINENLRDKSDDAPNQGLGAPKSK